MTGANGPRRSKRQSQVRLQNQQGNLEQEETKASSLKFRHLSGSDFLSGFSDLLYFCIILMSMVDRIRYKIRMLSILERFGNSV